MKTPTHILWLDTGTSGSLARPHCWRLAGVLDIARTPMKRFDWKMQPTNLRGTSKLAFFSKPERVMKRFVKMLEKHDAQFVLAGYNTPFDANVLAVSMKEAGLFNFQNLFSTTFIDVMRGLERFRLGRLKLEKACEIFNVPLSAHNAASDIEATRMLFCKVFRGYMHESYCYGSFA